MSKRLAELSAADIDELCRSGTAEGQFLDFKENLSGKGRDGDDWNNGSDKISERSTIELARVLVAFANADGGWVILGIRESTKPARAEAIAPLRDCHDLARRLRQSIYERIDPAPAGLEAWAVETDPSTGRGVVVFRMAASAYAPHGIKKDGAERACYIRRNDECRPMTMRDVQERTLEVARGLQGITGFLDERRHHFAEFHPIKRHPVEIGYRITLLPTRARVRVERIHLSPNLLETRHWQARFADARKPVHLLKAATAVGIPRPILRGARATSAYDDKAFQITATEDGMVEMLSIRGSDMIYVGWLLGDVLHMLDMGDKVRSAAGQPEAEYALDIEIVREGSKAGNQAIIKQLADEWGDRTIVLVAPCRLPIYSVEGADGFGALAKEILTDIENAGGLRADDGVRFELV